MRNNIRFIGDYGLGSLDYHSTFKSLRENMFELSYEPPQWGDMFEDLVMEAYRDVAHTPGDYPIVIGHGGGGDLALRAAASTDRSLGGLIIASGGLLSADGLRHSAAAEVVKEQFPGQHDQRIIARDSLAQIAASIPLQPSQVAVLVGKREREANPYMGEFAETIASAFEVDVTVVPGAPHIIEYSPRYVDAITEAALRIHEASGQ